MQICIALEYIHGQKIIHRDLKTQNILLTKTGDIKISDFGISRILSNSDEFASTSIGTPYYIAPEVCKGESYNYQADVWSLGCIIYELCSLKRPFEGNSIAIVLDSILNKEPETISGSYSIALISLVFSMLIKNPSQRPTVSKIIESINVQMFGEHKVIKPRKSYQKEISIKIPTPTNGPIHKASNSESINNNELYPVKNQASYANNGALSNRSATYFNFSESLLKYCPSSPIRPMLIGDFLKRRLGNELFERIQKVINNSIDPSKLLHEEPWIFSNICGDDNLSIIEAAITCGAFDVKNKTIFSSTTTNKNNKSRAFSVLSRHASQ